MDMLSNWQIKNIKLRMPNQIGMPFFLKTILISQAMLMKMFTNTETTPNTTMVDSTSCVNSLKDAERLPAIEIK
jgi:hypothetical protein